jgi:hypothetical protein
MPNVKCSDRSQSVYHYYDTDLFLNYRSNIYHQVLIKVVSDFLQIGLIYG